jgi:hypothetical protein
MVFFITTILSKYSSDKYVGLVLGEDEDNEPYAIYFMRKFLDGAELNYTITKNEPFAVVHSLNKLRHYVTGYKKILTCKSCFHYIIDE